MISQSLTPEPPQALGTRSCQSIYCLSTDANAGDDDADDDNDNDHHDDDVGHDADDNDDVNNDAGEHDDDDEEDDEAHAVTRLPEPLAASIRCAGALRADSDSRPVCSQLPFRLSGH